MGMFKLEKIYNKNAVLSMWKPAQTGFEHCFRMQKKNHLNQIKIEKK